MLFQTGTYPVEPQHNACRGARGDAVAAGRGGDLVRSDGGNRRFQNDEIKVCWYALVRFYSVFLFSYFVLFFFYPVFCVL